MLRCVKVCHNLRKKSKERSKRIRVKFTRPQITLFLAPKPREERKTEDECEIVSSKELLLAPPSPTQDNGNDDEEFESDNAVGSLRLHSRWSHAQKASVREYLKSSSLLMTYNLLVAKYP